MDVVFVTETGQRFTIQLGFSDHILEVKQKVAKRTLIPVDAQTLVFRGYTLADYYDTSHYGIVHGSQVLLYDTANAPFSSAATAVPGSSADFGVDRMNTQPQDQLIPFDVDTEPYISTNIGVYNVDSQLMPESLVSSGEFINPFYTSTGFTNMPATDVAGGSVNPPKKTPPAGHYYYPYISNVLSTDSVIVHTGGGTANYPQTMTSTGGYVDPLDPSLIFTMKPKRNVVVGNMPTPPTTSTGGYHAPISPSTVVIDKPTSNVGDGDKMPPQLPKTTTSPNTILPDPSTDKRKGKGGDAALMPPPKQRQKTTSSPSSSKAITEKLPEDKVGGSTAMMTPRKMALTMKLMSPSEKAVLVEVHSGDKMSVLRKELEKLQAEKKIKLPDDYFFIHKQNPIYEEDLTFFASGVGPGGTIDILPGSISNPQN